MSFMFRNLRLKSEPLKYASDDRLLTLEYLQQDASGPVTLRQLNSLPENARQRIYRSILPPDFLAQFGIDPISWLKDGKPVVRLEASADTGKVALAVRESADAHDEFIQVELSDNTSNGIDLDLLVLSTPNGDRYGIDQDEQNRATLFGTLHRNQVEEEKAKHAGLAPAQLRGSLGGSMRMLEQIDTFLSLLGHRAYFLEPLTYASAWVFERRGFAYVRGHKLMEEINHEFQPSGCLYQALDGSTPFRHRDQWNSVRGRAWAIHDGVLQSIGAVWNSLRMVKQVGHCAGVNTFPGGSY